MEPSGSRPMDHMCIRKSWVAGQPALYAGTLRISGQVVLELTNLSGTFRCDDDDGLVIIADWLRKQGWHIARDSVRFFPFDGGTPYIVQP